MVRRTKADAMETRAALLDAAERLFSEQGVTNTSMMQVAEAAGVTRGAIYHHFENKSALIDSLMERVRLPIEEMRVELIEEHQQRPLHQIATRTKHFVQHMQSDAHARSLMEILLHKCEYIEASQSIKKRHIEGRNECIDEFELLFKEAISIGELPQQVDSRHAVIGLFSMIDGLMYNWLLSPSYFDITDVANQAIEAYLCGLKSAS